MGLELDDRDIAEQRALEAQVNGVTREADRLGTLINNIQTQLQRLEQEIMSSTFMANPSNASLEEAREINRYIFSIF